MSAKCLQKNQAGVWGVVGDAIIKNGRLEVGHWRKTMKQASIVFCLERVSMETLLKIFLGIIESPAATPTPPFNNIPPIFIRKKIYDVKN